MVWQNQSDGELLADFLRTENTVFLDELVRRHGRMVLGVCRRVAGSACAEDAAQMVFVAMLRRAESLSQRSSIGGWLYRAAWNVASRGRRDAAARRANEIEAARQRQQEFQPAESLDEQIVQLHRAMNLLPVAYRDALVLHHLEGYTVEEVGSIMACPVGTAAARLSRGRLMLREELESLGVTLSVSALSMLLRDELIEQAELAFVEWTARGLSLPLLGSAPVVTCAAMAMPGLAASGPATASMLPSHALGYSGTPWLPCESAGGAASAMAAPNAVVTMPAVPVAAAVTMPSAVFSTAAAGVASAMKHAALFLVLALGLPAAAAVVYTAMESQPAGAGSAGSAGGGSKAEPWFPSSSAGHNAVPEPGTLMLFGPALATMLLRRRRGTSPTA